MEEGTGNNQGTPSEFEIFCSFAQVLLCGFLIPLEHRFIHRCSTQGLQVLIQSMLKPRKKEEEGEVVYSLESKEKGFSVRNNNRPLKKVALKIYEVNFSNFFKTVKFIECQNNCGTSRLLIQISNHRSKRPNQGLERGARGERGGRGGSDLRTVPHI